MKGKNVFFDGSRYEGQDRKEENGFIIILMEEWKEDLKFGKGVECYSDVLNRELKS
jgi:hypothetical protein